MIENDGWNRFIDNNFISSGFYCQCVFALAVSSINLNGFLRLAGQILMSCVVWWDWEWVIDDVFYLTNSHGSPAHISELLLCGQIVRLHLFMRVFFFALNESNASVAEYLHAYPYFYSNSYFFLMVSHVFNTLNQCRYPIVHSLPFI